MTTTTAARVAGAKYNKKAANQLKNNLGRKINLNNAQKVLQKEIANLKNEIRVRYNRGEFVGRYNIQQRRLENLLRNVNRKLRLRGPPIQRHFTPRELNVLNKPGDLHTYLSELNKLVKKYRIPQLPHRWGLVHKMINSNREARNQLARQYGLHWEMKARGQQWKRRRTSN